MVSGRIAAQARNAGPVIPGERPEPPDSLDPAAAEVWRATINALPAGWIAPEAFEVLVQFCRHTTYANWIAEQVNALMAMTLPFDSPEAKRLRMLMRMQAQQSERIASLSVKLRLVPSSRSTADRARDERKTTSLSGVPKPWLDWDRDPPQQ